MRPHDSEGVGMRIGVDVGGTNTDAVLMDGATVAASIKAPTTADVGAGVVAAIEGVMAQSAIAPEAITGVMIGTHPVHQRDRRAPAPGDRWPSFVSRCRRQRV